MTAWVCLALALAFAGLGMLAVVKARTFPLFFAAVGATEFGHFFAVGAVILAAVAPRDSLPGAAAGALFAIAAALLFSPLVRAWWAAKGMRRVFEAAFGKIPRSSPAGWRSLWIPRISHRPRAQRLVAEGPGGKLAIDFLPARGVNSAPLVVVVHGGGWMAGGSDEFSGWNGWLAARGFAVAAVDYRIVPTGVWPAQAEDVLAAIDHLRAHAIELGIDPERIVLLGRSAGGQIASAIAVASDRTWLRGCVCLYAPFDMVFAYEHSREDDMLRSRWLLRCFLGGSPAQAPQAYHDASAWLTVRPSAPPFLLMHGARDELVWTAQSERFARRLEELGVPQAFLKLPWATHAFDYNMTGPGGRVLGTYLEPFLRKVCGPGNV